MNLIGFKREPGGGFYLRLWGSCRLLSHSSAILQPQVPMAIGQGISIRASAPYRSMIRFNIVTVFVEEGNCIFCLQMRADKLMRHLISGELTS
jgi:hypothetical protein